MGIFSGVGGEDTKEKLLRALAIASGDSRTAAVLSDSITKRRDDREARKENRAVEAELTSLFEDEFLSQGYGPEDARRMARLTMLDAKSGGKNVGDRLGVQKVGQGDDIYYGRNKVISRPPALPSAIAEANAFNALPPDQQRGVANALDVTRGPAMKQDAYGRMIPVPRSNFLAPPKPGAVDEGYRFKGGDPANPANWEPVDQVGGEYLSIPRLGGR